MAELTLAPEGSGSFAKLQLWHELLRQRSDWTPGYRMSDNKHRKMTQEISMNVCIIMFRAIQELCNDIVHSNSCLAL